MILTACMADANSSVHPAPCFMRRFAKEFGVLFRETAVVSDQFKVTLRGIELYLIPHSVTS